MPAADSNRVFCAGAYAIDVTPANFPVTINGGFLQKTASKAFDRLHARCLVLDDGSVRLAIVVVDSCMMPRELIDEAKELARRQAHIPTERMLISATHTHSAPAAMGCLGSSVDEHYAKWLPGRIADGILMASKNLAPARVGWTVVDDWEHTNCRRWIKRSDKPGTDPFGEKSVRAMMHPGYQNPDYIGPSGPIDPGLSLLAVQSREGRPLALLANYSMHYFGASAVSADYYGKFCEGIGKLIGARGGGPPFVGILSQGTSGDSQWMDYSQPKKNITLDEYAEGVMRVAAGAVAKIQYQDWVSLAMAETEIKLRRRVADEPRLAWARRIVGAMDGRVPTNQVEVYAREQVLIHRDPERHLKLQALRIGDLGVTAIPNEVFAITGLKLKTQSPLATTFNIELANGAEGYIPPPEQHKLGGYTTWAARTAGLEPKAEPVITEAGLRLLEKVSGKSRRSMPSETGPYPEVVLASKPKAYWRLDGFNVPSVPDVSGHRERALLEGGVAVYLPGAQTTGGEVSGRPQLPSPFSGSLINRAAHFAGGRMKSELLKTAGDYSVEFWLWNGFPNDVRSVTGYLCSLGLDGDKSANGDHLGLGGTHGTDSAGRLIFFNGNTRKELLVGRTEITPKTWHHVALVREGSRVGVFLDGNLHPEITGSIASTVPKRATLFLGGRCDNFANFEGKLDEVAVFDRALTSGEIASHFALAQP